MEKIEEYVVFKYEDEFGFHYMKMASFPGRDLHTWSPSRSGRREKAIDPIREAYNRLSPSRRSMFIAQVIYLLIK